MGLLWVHFVFLFVLLAQSALKVTSQDLGITGCPRVPVRLPVTLQTDEAIGTWSEPMSTNSNVELVERSHIPGEAVFSVGFTDVEYTFRDTVTRDEEICSFTFIVFWAGDDQPPQVQGCPQDIIRMVSNSATTATVAWNIPTATDNAGPVQSTATHVPPFEFPVGTTPVMYTFVDTAALVSTCQFNVNIMEEDVMSPTINCPGDQSVEAPIGATVTVVRWPEVTATDNSGTLTLVSMKPQTALIGLIGGTFTIGTTNVCYVYSDMAGNLATCAFTVEVRVAVDTDPPVVSCIANGPDVFTVASGDNGQAFWAVPMVISDDSMPVQTMSNFDPGDFFPIGITGVQYRFIDRVGNEASCEFNVVVLDRSPPVFNNCPQRDIAAQIPIGQMTIVVSWEPITAADNSGLQPAVTGTRQSGEQFSQGSTMVNFTAEDESSNQATCTFNVVVTQADDDTPPLISGCPTTITSVAPDDQQGSVVGWTEPTAEDDSGVPTRFRSHVPPMFFQIGRTEVLYTFSDLAGNTVTCPFDVIVLDQTPPDITNCPSSPIQVSLSGQQTMTTVTFIPPTATDNSPDVITDDCTHNSGDVFSEGTTNVICVFSDASGNSNQCMFQVIVEGADLEPPIIRNCPDDITRQATGPENVIVTWPCLIVTDDSGIQPTRLVGPPNCQDSFAPGTSETVTYIYRDEANNIAQCMFTVTTVTATAPVVDCGGLDTTRTAPFNEAGVTVVLPSCSATSSAGIVVTQVSQTPSSGSFFSIGTTTVTNIFQDSNGVQGSGTFTVTVIPSVDMESPVVDCSGEDFTIDAPVGSSGVTVTLPRCRATDNSGQAIFLSQNPSSGSLLPIGENQVTVVYRDPSSNTGSDSFTVTVMLVMPLDPNIVCPMDARPVSGNIFVWSNPTCTEGQGLLSISCNPPAGSTFRLGTTTVTCSCADSGGRSSSCSFPVAVDDNEPPNVDCLGEDIIVTAPAGASGVTVTLPRCSATDNSGQANFVSQNPSSGSFFPIGDTQVTVVYQDPSGNTGVGSFTVTVQSDVVITCPTDGFGVPQAGTDVIGVWSDPVCVGGVTPRSTSCTPQIGSLIGIGDTQVICTCTDSRGTNAECGFTVSVVDDVSPLVDCSGEDVIVTAPAGAFGVTVTLPRCSASDNSGQANFVSQNPSSGSFFPVGDTQVTVVYRDPSGNTGVGFFTVTVQSDVVITCPTDSFGVPQAGTDVIGVWSEPVCVGGVTPRSTSCTPQVGSLIGIGDTQVICTCTDSRGTNAECGFTVSVEIPAVDIVCPSDARSVPAVSSDTFVWSNPTCTGGVSPLSTGCNPPPGSIFGIGTTTVTCFCADSRGTSNTCTFPVTVVDDVSPLVDCSGEDVIVTAPVGASGVTVILPRCSATDNSGQANFVSQNPSSGSFFPIGDTQVTVVYRDPSDNTGVGFFTVTVQSDVVITCPTDSFGVPQAGTDVIGVWSDPVCVGGVTPRSTSCTPQVGSLIGIGDTQVICTCTDSRGTNAECGFTVSVEIPPVDIVCPNDARNVSAVSSDIFVWSNPTCTGGVSPLSTGCNPPPGSIFGIGTMTVTCFCADSRGTSNMCTFPVTVVDDIPPLVDCSGEDVIVTAPVGASGVTVILPRCSATDNSGQTNFVSQNPSSGSFFPIGDTQVTVVYRDPSGNTGVGFFTVTVLSDVVITCPTDGFGVPQAGTDVIGVWSDPVCVGGVTPRSTSCTPQVGSLIGIGDTQVICTCTDSRGTNAECGFTVSVEIPPVDIVCPNDAQSVPAVSSDSFVWSNPTCTGGVSPLSNGCNPPSGSTFGIGTTTVTCFCADSRGTSNMCTFPVTIVDDIPPLVDCSGEDVIVTAPVGVSGVTVILPRCSATDNSGQANFVSQNPSSGSFFLIGDTQVTVVYRDPSGNTGVGFFTVTVQSDVVITCPTDGFGVPQAGTDVIGVWSDPVCVGGVTPRSTSCTPQVGSLIGIGDTQVICTCTDSRGTNAECGFTVSVEIPPVDIVCPNDARIVSAVSSDTFVWSNPTCTGGVSPLSTGCNPPPGSIFGIGTMTVTCFCADSRGTSNSCTFPVTVVDELPPSVVCSDISVTVPSEQLGSIVELNSCIVSDNSGLMPTLLLQDPSSGSFFVIGTTSVTVIYVDQAGNVGSGMLIVRVEVIDDVPPVVNCDGLSTTVRTTVDQSCARVTFQPCTATDNQGRATLVSQSHQSGFCFLEGITEVTFRFRDDANNIGMDFFTVTVIRVDDTPPFIIGCPDDIIRQTLITTGGDIVFFEAPTAVDASGSAEVVNDPIYVSGSYFPIGTTSVTYVFADPSGNLASCTFRVTVIGANPCNNSRCFNGGVCIALTLTDSVCVCTGCFTGPTCQVSAGACEFNTCQNEGTCQPLQGSCQAAYCTCPPCYTGLTCQTRVSACRNHECQNGAVCIPASIDCDQYTCQCPSCFIGDFCQIAIPNPCSSAPCLNGGQCSRDPNSCYDISCTCRNGFSGERCEQVVNILDNPCNSFPCRNQGSCISFGSTYKCICRPGFLGMNCGRVIGGALSFEGCVPISPCQNGGTCFESYTSTSGFDPFFSQYTCVCVSGFTGERCTIPVNQAPQLNRCLGTNICQNGGTCQNSYCSFQDRIDFFCECPIGFIGEVCSIPYDNPCSTVPCGDGGVCQPFNQYFVCSCFPGYSGITCDEIRDVTPPTVSGCPQQPIVVSTPLGSSTAVVSWSEPTAVDNSGEIVELVSVNARPGARYPVGTRQVLYVFEDVAGNQNTCTFSITVVEATDACNPNPCQNGGNCQIINGRFSCICQSGFTGQTCSQLDTSDNPCTSSPCRNGGTCVMLTSALFVCLCETGFDGISCENAEDVCSTRPCQNGGTCISVSSGNFECLCDTGFQGSTCQSAEDACSTRPCQNGGTCIPVSSENFACLCDTGFQGSTCQSGGVDVTPPDIMNCPGNTTVTFTPGLNFVEVAWTSPTAEDESPPITQEQNRVSPAFLQRGQTLNVIYEFTDRLGNTATCSFFFFSTVL